jgi:hypothetical protein
MKKLMHLVGAIVLIMVPSLASAQAGTANSVAAPAGFAPMQAPCVQQADKSCVAVSVASPFPTTAAPLSAAASTALNGTATSSAVTPTSGAATIAAGVATIGPLAPELGRGIRVILRGTWSGTFALGTSVDACVTVNPLTIGGMTWGSFTGSANEIVDIPTLAGVVYCATATISSGTLTYGVRQ